MQILHLAQEVGKCLLYLQQMQMQLVQQEATASYVDANAPRQAKVQVGAWLQLCQNNQQLSPWADPGAPMQAHGFTSTAKQPRSPCWCVLLLGQGVSGYQSQGVEELHAQHTARTVPP